MKRSSRDHIESKKRLQYPSPEHNTNTQNTELIKDGPSTRQEAERYRLATARLPLETLKYSCARGMNRAISQRQVSRLCRIFSEGHLERCAEENYVFVLCRAELVKRMIAHLEKTGDETNTNRIHDFSDWFKINSGEKVEILAGQHRLEALRKYVAQTGAEASELWWPCNIYDQDHLPFNLNIQLRVNRHDLTMPDSHGDVWNQVVMAACHDERIFQGKKTEVEKKLREILRLDDVQKVPISRLVTLWNNERWRSMISRWCETRLGAATFNISTWEWMASCRIDSYWFSGFDQVLTALDDMPGEAIFKINAGDWTSFATRLTIGYTNGSVKELFYPARLNKDLKNSEKTTNLMRRKYFLKEMDDDEYYDIYHYIIEHPRIVFSKLQSLLKTTKEEGKIMMMVMTHVVTWLNPIPTVVINMRQNNKPLLREDLKPALQKLANTRLEQAAVNDKSSTYWSHHNGLTSSLELESIVLEKLILDFVREEMAVFKSPHMMASLEEYSSDDLETYGKRFATKPWDKLLNAVESFFQPSFWSITTLGSVSRQYRASRSHHQNASRITTALCRAALELPEVINDPELSSAEAVEELRASVEKAIGQWITHRHQCEVEDHPSEDGALRPVEYGHPLELKDTHHKDTPSRRLPTEGGRVSTLSYSTSDTPGVYWTPFRTLFSRNEH